MIRAHHLSCALPFCYYVIDSTSDHQALALGGWGPLLPSTRAFESLDETVLLPEILSSSIFHTDAPGELFTVPLMLGLNPSMPPCHTQEKVQALENGAKAESWPGTFTPTCLPTCAQPQITPNTHTHTHTHILKQLRILFYLADKTEELSLGCSPSGTSERLLQRGKGGARINRGFCNKDQVGRTSKDYC